MNQAASEAAGPLTPLAAAVRRTSWLDALVTASLLSLSRPDLWVLALAGFLVRGGIVLLLLPILILPSPIQLAASFGLDAVSISGEPTARFVEEVVLAIVVLLAWFVLSAFAGAAIDVIVNREVAGGGEAAGASEAAGIGGDLPLHPTRALLRQLVTARLLTLVPLAIAVAWAARRLIDVGYQEVTVPSDTATPLVLRIAAGAADALATIVAVWLLTELLLTVATRRILFGRPSGTRPVRKAVAGVVRGFLPVAGAFAAGTAVSAVVLGLAVVGTSMAWNAVLFTLRSGDGIVAGITVMALVLVWCVSLVLAAFLSAWRSTLVTSAYLWAREDQDSRPS